MIVYPAMDLIGGRCVRLVEGDFARRTDYDVEPAANLAAFRDAGAQWVHIVDLDGAKAGRPMQHDLIASLARGSGLKVQAGGGVRGRAEAETLLAAGIDRVVIGSWAVKDPDCVRALIEDAGPDRVALAPDVRIENGRPMVAIAGWTEISARALPDLLAEYAGAARHVLLTDIGKDGRLEGPNEALIEETAAAFPALAIQASGGVRGAEDLKALRAAGAAGAIVGKALYEGRLALGEALSAAEEA